MPVRTALKVDGSNKRVASAATVALISSTPTSSAEISTNYAQEAQVQQHPDADEEEPQQDVAERPDHTLDLMPVLGFREHHAGEEGAQGERQAR